MQRRDRRRIPAPTAACRAGARTAPPAWAGREGRVAPDAAIGVHDSPAEQRHRIARGDHRRHVLQIGRRGLIVDVDLVKAHRLQPVVPAGIAEDIVRIQAQHPEGQHRHEVQRGDPLAGKDQLVVLKRRDVAPGCDPQIARHIDHAARGRCHQHRPVVEIVPHAEIAQQIGEQRRSRRAQQAEPVGRRVFGEGVRAARAAAARFVAHHDRGLPRQVTRQQRRVEPRPDIRPPALRERDDQFDRLAGKVDILCRGRARPTASPSRR